MQCKSGRGVKSQNQKLSITGLFAQKRTDCSVNEFLDLQKTGNVTAAIIKKSGLGESHVIDAVSRWQDQKFEENEWDILI